MDKIKIIDRAIQVIEDYKILYVKSIALSFFSLGLVMYCVYHEYIHEGFFPLTIFLIMLDYIILGIITLVKKK